MSKVFLPKDDQRIPDYYGVTVEDITGRVRAYKVASHVFLDNIRAVELLTFDNEYVVIPLDNVVLSFSKEFTRLLEIKKELENQKSQPTKEGNNLNGSGKKKR